MEQDTYNKNVSFIWGIVNEVCRDHFKRGKYGDMHARAADC